MTHSQNSRNAGSLWGLIALAVLVDSLFHFLPRLSGTAELDGLGAVLLGLYICSRPATNALNLLLYGSGLRSWNSLGRGDVAWLALNFLVLVSGLTVIVTGTTRFFSQPL